MQDKRNIIIIVLGIALAILIKFYFTKADKLEESQNLLDSSNSELILSKDKLGNEIAKREVMQTYNTKLFTSLKTQDSLIKELQVVVKDVRKQIKKGGSATMYEGETNVDQSTVTNIFQNTGDSLPTYKSEFNNEWLKYSINSSFDSTSLDLKVKNKYSIVLGSEKKNIFSKRVPFATITNYNPYSFTTDTRTYQVKMKTKRFTFGVQAGYGITNSGLGPYFGVGGGYTLLRF